MKAYLQLGSMMMLMLLLACGDKAGPNIDITFDTTAVPSAFSDANVVDLVMIVANVPTDGEMLDLDGNGSADQFVFPEACGTDLAPSCGYPIASATTTTLGGIPLGYRYLVVAQLRDGSGTSLYSAQALFDNSGVAGQVLLTLAAGGS